MAHGTRILSLLEGMDLIDLLISVEELSVYERILIDEKVFRRLKKEYTRSLECEELIYYKNKSSINLRKVGFDLWSIVYIDTESFHFAFSGERYGGRSIFVSSVM